MNKNNTKEKKDNKKELNNQNKAVSNGIQEPKSFISIDISQILLIITVVGLVSFIFLYITNGDQEHTKQDEVLANLALECEQGKWVTFPSDRNIEEKIKGDIKFKGEITSADLPNDEMTNGKEIIITHSDYSLIFYDGRNVEIEGWNLKPRKGNAYIYAHRIRCVGDESKLVIRDIRQSAMQYIEANKQAIFELSGYKGHVEIDEIAFVNNEVMYVTFTQEDENKTDVIVLVEVKKNNDEYNSKMLAQYEYDEEGRVLAGGKNEYSGQKTTAYEYDDESNRWVLVW